MSDVMRELKPCPFCGSPARRGYCDIPAVECSNEECCASLHRYEPKDAIEAWNRRSAAIEQAVRDADRYRHLCDMLDDGDVSESTIYDIMDDAMNMGSGALNLFLDEEMAQESNNDKT